MKFETTRLATIRDVGPIIQLIKEYFVQSPYRDYRFSDERVQGILETMIIDPQNSCVAVSVSGDDVVGVIVGHKIAPAFSYDTVGVELIWYLKEAYRTPRRGYELLKMYEMWGEWSGCKFLQYAKLNEGPPEEGDEGSHRGYSKTEVHYQKRL